VYSAFQAKALLYGTPPKQLRDAYLDVAWCPADLYYIQKLALTMDLFAQAGWQKVE
jgi:hypothetical protein